MVECAGKHCRESKIDFRVIDWASFEATDCNIDCGRHLANDGVGPVWLPGDAALKQCPSEDCAVLSCELVWTSRSPPNQW